MPRLSFFLLSIVLLAACGQQQSPQASEAEPEPQAEMDAGDDGLDGSSAEPDSADAPAPEADVPMADMNEANSPVVEEVELTTEDGKAIVGEFSRPAGASGLAAVLLLHQFGNSRQEWADFSVKLVDAGFAVLAIDLRGHGESDPANGEVSGIFRDPDQAPRDVSAALEFLQRSASVNPGRIAAVGTSIGSNLTVVAMTLGFGVKTIVAMSPRLSAIEALAGDPETISVSSILCYAGELDSAGAQAETCRTLTQDATGESRLRIFEGSAVHGADILEQFPEEADEVLSWLEDEL